MVSRDYRGDIEGGEIDKFLPLAMEREDEGTTTPIIASEHTTFLYIKHNNIYIVAATKRNPNVVLIFTFLHKLVQVRPLLSYVT